MELNLLLVDETHLISVEDSEVWDGIRALHQGQSPSGTRPMRVVMAATHKCMPSRLCRMA